MMHFKGYRKHTIYFLPAFTFCALSMVLVFPSLANAQSSQSLGVNVTLTVIGTGTPTSTPTTTPTTTPPNPSPSGPSSFSSTHSTPLSIFNLSVSTAEQSAFITWSTNNVSLSVLSWGTTSDYALGSISDIGFASDHQVKIQNLTPGTHYYFRISGHDLFAQNVVEVGDFYTLSLPNLVTLPNVKDLNIKPQSNDLFVTWQNPPVPEFAGVVVVRSPYTYPRDVSDGKIIYDGTGDFVTDMSVQKDTVYYYSVFVYDSQKNISSGAIATAKISSVPTKPITKPTSIASSTLPTEATFSLKLSDVDFIQDGHSVISSGTTVPVFSDKNLTVSISLSKIPAKIDLGTLKIADPTGLKTDTYLFLFNAPRVAYESQINLYGAESGIYPFTIVLELADGKRAVLSAEFAVIKTYNAGLSSSSVWEIVYGIILGLIWLIIAILVLIIIIFGLYKLSKKIKPLS